ncbi:AcrR family transcriptional regulator [Kutzneria viridogrisea]|uniref:AcrR family transcriptional regulator n=1 Tax=Kutzneria viridogrisea TaxID=47990 RepID=A0ABR6BVQ9_9PSEU|nr:TetR/AcrR family transcriptional regulator [Kutzneria albida]MBA8930987.1 AcrR family transcriptional regulator [Kutzneria viridogrisea]
MPSQRHSTRVEDEVLLDAVRACVLALGVRRTTLTDVARRAGVSRMTLYRRFPDVRSLMAALMTREFGGLLSQFEQGPTARHQLVDGVVNTVRRLIANPLLSTVLDLDPELLLPYVVQRLGSTQQLAEQVLLAQIRAGHEDGSVRAGKPSVQARALLLAVQSFVLSSRAATADVPEEDLLAELAELVDGALRPRGEES